MDVLSAAYFDDTITAASKIRATTSYALPAVGAANTAYISGNFDAYVPVGQYATGVRPGYGFYAAGVLGTYLYAETGAELRLRTNTGQEYTMWNSGNSRSDAQNDARYSQLGHTHAIADVTGLQAALDAKATVSGTVGRLAKIGSGNTLVDSIVTEIASSSVRVAGTISSDTVAADVNARGYTVLTNGLGRWITGKAGSETGSNAGSDYVFWRLDDAGSFLGEALRLSRANGNATFSGTITASGGNSTNWNTAFSWGNHSGLYVPTSRTVTAGTGLTGGGALSSNITLSFDTTYGDGRYAALSHTHAITDVTGLQAALDAKATASGTVGKIPKFATGNSFVDSLITEVSATTVRVAGVITSDTTTADTNARGFTVLTGGVGRWIVGKAGSETGSNAGSDWVFWRLNDAGTFLGEAMRLSRANGNATFAGTITASGGNSTNWNTAFSWGNHASAGYVPTSRTLTINGTAFDLSANRSWTVTASIGSGTNGFLTKWNGSVLADSSIDDSDVNYLVTTKGFRFAKASGSWYFTGESNASSANLVFTNPSNVSKFLVAGSNTGLDIVIPGVGYVVSFLNNRNLQAFNQIESLVSTGTAPFIINSSTVIPNLNADMVDGLHASSFALASSISGTAGRLAKIGTGGNIVVDSIVTEASGAIQVAGTISSDTATADVNARGFTILTSSVGRWIVGKAGSETGSNAGSDFVFWRLNDAGSFLGEAMRLSRANGNATFAGSITASGGNSGNWNTAFSWGNHASAGYVPGTRTLTINGTTFDLSANRSWTISGGGVGGSGTNGFVTKWSGGNLTDSSIDDSNGSYIKINKDFRVNNDGSRYWVEFTSNTSAAGLSFYNPGGSTNYGMYYLSDGSFQFQRGGTQLMRFTSGNNVEFQNGSMPFVVNSTATVSNLSADMVDGVHASSLVQTSRTLTINGTTYDLSANRSWTISGGVGGSGSTNYVPMWNGSTSLTNSLLEFVGGVLMRVNGRLQIDDLFLLKRVTASERASMSTSLGGQVYQTDGTEGVWTYKSSGWVAGV